MPDYPLELNRVSKDFGQFRAVNELSLRMPAGCVYGFLGPNGAGKTTTIRMILDITRPSSGTISILGATSALKVRERIGYLPEELIFYDQLTGTEYLRLVAGLKEADPAQIDPEIEFFELNRAADKLIGGYSLGMRKKLGLAAAMIGPPEILVLDEPLNGLDVEMMRKLRLRLQQERERERAMLISSHVMSFVERISDRVGIMKAGRLVAEGSPAELRAATGLDAAPFEDVFFQLAG